jgi:hypothetical protein
VKKALFFMDNAFCISENNQLFPEIGWSTPLTSKTLLALIPLAVQMKAPTLEAPEPLTVLEEDFGEITAESPI